MHEHPFPSVLAIRGHDGSVIPAVCAAAAFGDTSFNYACAPTDVSPWLSVSRQIYHSLDYDAFVDGVLDQQEERAAAAGPLPVVGLLVDLYSDSGALQGCFRSQTYKRLVRDHRRLQIHVALCVGVGAACRFVSPAIRHGVDAVVLAAFPPSPWRRRALYRRYCFDQYFETFDAFSADVVQRHAHDTAPILWFREKDAPSPTKSCDSDTVLRLANAALKNVAPSKNMEPEEPRNLFVDTEVFGDGQRTNWAWNVAAVHNLPWDPDDFDGWCNTDINLPQSASNNTADELCGCNLSKSASNECEPLSDLDDDWRDAIAGDGDAAECESLPDLISDSDDEGEDIFGGLTDADVVGLQGADEPQLVGVPSLSKGDMELVNGVIDRTRDALQDFQKQMADQSWTLFNTVVSRACAQKLDKVREMTEALTTAEARADIAERALRTEMKDAREAFATAGSLRDELDRERKEADVHECTHHRLTEQLHDALEKLALTEAAHESMRMELQNELALSQRHEDVIQRLTTDKAALQRTVRKLAKATTQFATDANDALATAGVAAAAPSPDTHNVTVHDHNAIDALMADMCR
jgi:hypothetical protein